MELIKMGGAISGKKVSLRSIMYGRQPMYQKPKPNFQQQVCPTDKYKGIYEAGHKELYGPQVVRKRAWGGVGGGGAQALLRIKMNAHSNIIRARRVYIYVRMQSLGEPLASGRNWPRELFALLRPHNLLSKPSRFQKNYTSISLSLRARLQLGKCRYRVNCKYRFLVQRVPQVPPRPTVKLRIR